MPAPWVERNAPKCNHPGMGRRGLERLVLLAGALLLSGCHTHHYLVVQDGAPLYAAPVGDEELARLPRFHHQPLPEAPRREQGRVELRYRGRTGWVAPGAVRLFTYLHPDLDGGEERAEAVGRELRALQVETQGQGWSEPVQEAVKAGEVRRGMTRDQVELAWGWPVTVEGGGQGGERWVYRVRSEASFDRWQPYDPWCGGPFPWNDPWCGAGWRWGGCHRPLYGGGWAHTVVPVIEERRVEFDAAGKVATVEVRAYVDEGA